MDTNNKSREELLLEISNLKQENSVLQSELTIFKNGNLFKQLTEITSTLFIIYQKHKILYVNTAVARLLGYTEEEFLQTELKDIIHPEFQEIEERNRLSIQTGEKESVNFELKVIARNGSERWLDFNIHLFTWNHLPAIIGSANDITERKNIEEELVKFKLCIERSFEAIFLTDSEGNIIFINPSFEQIYGFSSTEAIGKTPRILKSGLYPDDVYQYFWETLLSKDVVTGEIINKTKNSKLITVEGFNTSILDSNGNIYGYIGIHRDISERKKAEESLKLFRTLIDNSNDSIEVLDPTSGCFMDVNETGCKELGYTRDEFLKLSVFDIDPVVTPDTFVEIVKEIRKSGYITWDGIHNRKDGSSFPVEVNIRIVNLEKEYMVTVARDISLRKQDEESILKLSRAVEQSPTSVMITDRDGTIEYINPKLTEVTGYKGNEVIGLNPRIFSSGEKPKSEYEILWGNILSGKEWKGEFHNKKKNGELYWEYANISPIITPNGEITHFVAIKEDITERREMIDELIRAKEKAEESDLLKSAFLANMSHEIRTPMNGILGFTGLLMEPELSEETKEAYIQIIHQSGERMLNTVTDIVEISKIEAGIVEVKNSKININESIESILEFFQLQAQNKKLILGSENEIQETNIITYTDKNKFLSILTNLIKNAIKFTKKGKITVSSGINEEFIEFCIKDTGIGIPKNRIEAIFNRFEQADIKNTRVYEGSGLGLAIAKSYVEMLGGKIWVESVEGKGSQFYFSIPYMPVEKDSTITYGLENSNNK